MGNSSSAGDINETSPQVPEARAEPRFSVELDPEEQLFAIMVYGSINECEDLLGRVANVNAKNGCQRTLLHMAVRIGRLEWVERLLDIGADPGIPDGSGRSSVEVALEMISKHPQDEDRKAILRLVRLCFEAKAAEQNSPTELGATSDEESPTLSNHVGGNPEYKEVLKLSRITLSFQGSAEETLREMTSKLNSLSQQIVSLSAEAACIKNKNEVLTQNMSLLGNSVIGVRSDLASVSRETILLGRKMDELKEEVMSVKTDNNTASCQLLSLREALNEVSDGFTKRDILMEVLEESVTSFSEEWRNYKDSLQEKPSTSTPEVLEQVEVEESVHRNCINRMLRKTSLCDWDEEKNRRVVDYYEKLYSASDLTSSILKFLQFQRQVEISVDFDSNSIVRMKQGVKNYDGVMCNGGHYRGYAHFGQRVVYLGGKVEGTFREEYVLGWLASTLCRLAIYLAFRNRGRPYEAEDWEGQRRYKRILEEAVELRERIRVRCDWYIRSSLNCKTEGGREIMLISAVPGMIAVHGYQDGISKLQEQLPSLLEFYQEHVFEKLRTETAFQFSQCLVSREAAYRTDSSTSGLGVLGSNLGDGKPPQAKPKLIRLSM